MMIMMWLSFVIREEMNQNDSFSIWDHELKTHNTNKHIKQTTDLPAVEVADDDVIWEW